MRRRKADKACLSGNSEIQVDMDEEIEICMKCLHLKIYKVKKVR